MKTAVAIPTVEDENSTIAEAYQKVMMAVTNRRENGGAKKNIRVAALQLIEELFDDLEADDR